MNTDSKCQSAANDNTKSTETSHTPGTWQMYDETYAPEEIYSGGIQICTCEPGESMISNARLIAAAPDLLREAKNILAWFDSTTTFVAPAGLRAAIIKAERRMA